MPCCCGSRGGGVPPLEGSRKEGGKRAAASASAVYTFARSCLCRAPLSMFFVSLHQSHSVSLPLCLIACGKQTNTLPPVPHLEPAWRGNDHMRSPRQLARLLLHVQAPHHHAALEGHASTQSPELVGDLESQLPAPVRARSSWFCTCDEAAVAVASIARRTLRAV